MTGVVLVAAAAAHRGILGEPEYTGHWLIAAEVVLALALLVFLLVQGVHALVLLFTSRWREMLLTITLWLLTLLLLSAALAIDSPTLLHAT